MENIQTFKMVWEQNSIGLLNFVGIIAFWISVPVCCGFNILADKRCSNSLLTHSIAAPTNRCC